MYIKKITLKNFRLFKDEISLDLQPNAHGMDPLRFWGNFKAVNQKAKKYASVINAIGGVNSSGKSTFIKAFDLLKQNSQGFLISQAYSKYLDKQTSKLFKNLTHDQVIDLLTGKIKNAKGDKEMQTIKKHLNSYQKILSDQRKILEENKLFKNADFQKFYEIEIKKLYEKNVTRCFNKTDGKDISIKLDLFSKNKDFCFEYTLNTKQEKAYFFDNKGKKIDWPNKDNEFFSKIMENILILNDDFEQSYLNTKHKNNFNDDLEDFEKTVAQLFHYLKNENEKDEEERHYKFLSLLKIADSNITKLLIQNNGLDDEKLLGFHLENGKGPVFAEDLSTGTKKLIKNSFKILNALRKAKKENYTSLIFIDEIENSLHFRLVDFIKKLIFNYSMSGNNVQLFYTSHNVNALDRLVDHRQIYLLDRDISSDEQLFERVSTRLKPHNSLSKQFLNAKIGSHPSKIDVKSLAGEIIDEI